MLNHFKIGKLARQKFALSRESQNIYGQLFLGLILIFTLVTGEVHGDESYSQEELLETRVGRNVNSKSTIIIYVITLQNIVMRNIRRVTSLCVSIFLFLFFQVVSAANVPPT